MSCISQASGKVLLRMVKIFYECRFSSTSRRLLLKLPRTNQSFLIQLQKTNVYPIDLFQAFHVCYYCLTSSSLSQSSSVLIFAGIKRKCYSISVGRVRLILLGLERGIFVNYKISAVVKKPFLL